MRRRSNQSAADEFASVRERWLAAQAEHDQAAAAVEEAKARLDERLGGLAQDLALGDLDVAGYERSKAEHGRSLSEAEAALTRSEAVVEALAARAFELETSIVSAREAEIRAASAAAQNEVAALEAKLNSARRLAEELDGQLEDAVRQVAEAGSEFDPVRRKADWARQTQEREVVAWFARNPRQVDQAPPRLRAAIAEECERLRRTAEAERAGLRERSRRQWEQLGVPEQDLANLGDRTFDRVA